MTNQQDAAFGRYCWVSLSCAETGKIKAEQIRKTGAKIVVTPCHNCIDQLSELNREYDLKVEIKTVSEVVADVLVIEKKER